MNRFFITTALILLALMIPQSGLSRSKAQESQASIPQDITQLLAAGDLKKAVFAIRELPSCPKTTYLLHSANRIALFEMEGKPSKPTAHEVYQNVAISYHNLYLFLKSQGIDQQDFFHEADRFYSKARRAGTHLHKAECDVLEAALIAASGDTNKAMNKFSKVDDLMLRGDFESMTYLAAYFAAVGDAARALDALDAAFAISPTKILAWLEVSDDFEPLKDDAGFAARLSTWRDKHKTESVTLTVPGCEIPRLEMTGTDPFGPTGFSKKAKRQLEARKKR